MVYSFLPLIGSSNRSFILNLPYLGCQKSLLQTPEMACLNLYSLTVAFILADQYLPTSCLDSLFHYDHVLPKSETSTSVFVLILEPYFDLLLLVSFLLKCHVNCLSIALPLTLSNLLSLKFPLDPSIKFPLLKFCPNCGIPLYGYCCIMPLHYKGKIQPHTIDAQLSKTSSNNF